MQFVIPIPAATVSVVATFVLFQLAAAGLAMAAFVIFQLKKIKELIIIIMATQEEFDQKIAAANTAVDAIAAEVTAKAKEISDFIAAQPKDVDTSAIDGVVTRLTGVANSVAGIFTPPAA